MNPTKRPADRPDTANRLPSAMYSTTNLSHAASAPRTPMPPTWSSQTSSFPAQNGAAAAPSYPQFSASTAEILKRISANTGVAAGAAAFEAKKQEVLQNFVTSDKLPTPPPIPNAGKRGKAGGRVGTPSALKTALGAASASPATTATPASARGSGRGRGRGRGGGRGGKRKRAESVESDVSIGEPGVVAPLGLALTFSQVDSDISSSYTPVTTRTKSGRNVNKPVSFVPTIPEPTPGVKRRRSTKTILAAQCKTCHRGTDPGNNRIVFCDVCNTAYHQYCHDPPIDDEVVNVLEKEWLCGPCERSKQAVIEGTDGLTASDGLSIEEKRAYFSTLPHARLVSLLLHSTIRHPELPIFPPDVRDLIPEPGTTAPSQLAAAQPQRQPPTPQGVASQNVNSPPNGIGSTGGTPRSQNMATDSSDMDPAEAQLLGEIRSHQTHSSTSAPNAGNQLDEYDDGYDTDPPAHYPKAGNGLARTLRPESEDMQWLVDDNFEVFSHGWKGDDTGVGADGTLNGLGDGDGMEGMLSGSKV
ncbi:hypothetical protein BDV95DRAFT_530302 [Massariosphaeria phaeospora]|uniref:PHD-type domain-containing protein n=1 Tax=Massariosphaeria phaeospora TaxID=100035 RepID=A0A7C8I5T6_9PLEO|nr:hypothetical protein BDV95DRAFT_530302 [Massariosphaeria phaeospora]